MKLPSDETPATMNGEGYISDEYDQLEMMPAPIRDGDFSEYMWMENEEEFNSQVLRQLEEEELMEQCLVAMLDDEYQMANNNSSRSTTSDANVNSRSNAAESNVNLRNNTNDNSNALNGLSESVDNLSISSNGVRSNTVSSNNSDTTNNTSRSPYTAQDRLQRLRQPPRNSSLSNGSEQKSTLNPDAKEFIPLTRTSSESTTPKNENVSS